MDVCQRLSFSISGGLCSGRLQHSSFYGLNSQLLANCRMLFLNTGPRQATYVHIQCLSIASASTRSRCYHDQLVFSDKVANAALFACRLVARVGLNIEFERYHERQEEGEEELEGEKHVGGFRLDEAIVTLRVVVLAIIDVGWMCFAVPFNV